MVLLVDDDQDLRDSVADLLRQRGYTVATAEDGHAALAIIAGARVPCIVLLDLVMPGMDGWKFLAVVQADPTLSAIPIVIASAHAATHAPAGTAGVLRKPFDFDELFTMVARHCGPGGAPAAAC
ncbi:MAG TPA: response regulator [Polyangia bacterium]|nr:response regulator [Polyangia bacterium]